MKYVWYCVGEDIPEPKQEHIKGSRKIFKKHAKVVKISQEGARVSPVNSF